MVTHEFQVGLSRRSYETIVWGPLIPCRHKGCYPNKCLWVGPFGIHKEENNYG